ncbi:MAG: hypothetical protein U1F10_13085 [Burkholderiales bacterium]
MLRPFLFLLLLATGVACAGELTLTLPGRGSLILDLPEGWDARIERPRAEMPPTVVIASRVARAYLVQVTPFWAVGPNRKPTAADIRSLVEGAVAEAAAQAEERDIAITEFTSNGRPGAYFSATDKAPEQDGYKYLTQGAIAVDELSVTFTVLSNRDHKEVLAKTLEMLSSAYRGPAQRGT